MRISYYADLRTPSDDDGSTDSCWVGGGGGGGGREVGKTTSKVRVAAAEAKRSFLAWFNSPSSQAAAGRRMGSCLRHRFLGEGGGEAE